jgi:hypothetical protein
MTDEFSNFDDDSFDGVSQDWMLDDDNENVLADSDSSLIIGDEDEFAELRQKSARSGSMYEDMDAEEAQSSDGSSFSWSNFSSGQRVVLALLIVLDILAIGFGVMVVTGII